MKCTSIYCVQEEWMVGGDYIPVLLNIIKLWHVMINGTITQKKAVNCPDVTN
jgi:hypothetical protein